MCPAIKLRLNDDAAKYIIDKTLTDRSYGARPLRRALQKYIEDPLSEALIQGTLPRPSELEVYLGESGIYVRQLQEEPQLALWSLLAPADSGIGPLFTIASSSRLG